VVPADSKLPPTSITKKLFVKEILEKRKVKNKVEYKVLYEGKTVAEAEWLPATLLRQDTPEIVKAYEAAQKKKK
jgi:hypothetical protein